MRLWKNKPNKKDRLHKLALQGIKATGKAMRATGQGEAYKQEISKQIAKSLAEQKVKNPALTLAGIMADYDKYPEDAKVYTEQGISREDFQEIAQGVLGENT